MIMQSLHLIKQNRKKNLPNIYCVCTGNPHQFSLFQTFGFLAESVEVALCCCCAGLLWLVIGRGSVFLGHYLTEVLPHAFTWLPRSCCLHSMSELVWVELFNIIHDLTNVLPKLKVCLLLLPLPSQLTYSVPPSFCNCVQTGL